ncbi:MAG TPA: PHB depolymerase family esterase [Flavitalea sp.]|nr:PHB depolymerase family esterase [Flavitalea sp.]
MQTCIRFILIAGLCAVMAACKKQQQPSDGERYSGSIAVDGQTRTYNIVLPPNYKEHQNFSLVIGMHGGVGNAEQFERNTRLTDKANAAGFIVVYPNGSGRLQTWNGGLCCGSAAADNVDDVKFISMLIDELTAKYKIDPKRVYATGHSNGGIMSYRLACELSHKIAAIAPNASTMEMITPCNPSRAVPILHMHSKLDENVPYQGGYGVGISNAYFYPLDSVFTVWASNNGCNPTPQTIVKEGYTETKWVDCNSNTVIDYYLTNDGSHAWPGATASTTGNPASTAIDANDLLWAFFQQHSLP